MLIDLSIDLINERRQDAFRILFETDQTPQNGFRLFSKLGETLLHGSYQISAEPLWILVDGVQREPAGGHLGLAGKIRQQGGFAIARRSRDNDEFPLQQVVKELQQPPAVQNLRTEGRNNNLGAADSNFGDHGFDYNFTRFRAAWRARISLVGLSCGILPNVRI